MGKRVLKVGLIALFVVVGVGLIAARFMFRPYYAPSEAMMPTLNAGDRFFVDKRAVGEVRRGDVIVFKPEAGEFGGKEYVKRVAGLPGDMFGVRDGIVHINGKPVAQRFIKRVPYSHPDNRVKEAKILAEQFPGEVKAHMIQELYRSPSDEFPDMMVPANRYFMLGDNRDNSADSRFTAEHGGSGLALKGNIVGRPMFIFFSSDPDRRGMGIK